MPSFTGGLAERYVYRRLSSQVASTAEGKETAREAMASQPSQRPSAVMMQASIAKPMAPTAVKRRNRAISGPLAAVAIGIPKLWHAAQVSAPRARVGPALRTRACEGPSPAPSEQGAH